MLGEEKWPAFFFAIVGQEWPRNLISVCPLAHLRSAALSALRCSWLGGQIAIATLLRRVPNLKTAIPSNAVRWRRGLVLRGLESLPVTFTRNSGRSTERRT